MLGQTPDVLVVSVNAIVLWVICLVMIVISFAFHILFVLLFLCLLWSLLLKDSMSTKKEDSIKLLCQRENKRNYLELKGVIEAALEEQSGRGVEQKKQNKEIAHRVCILLSESQAFLEGVDFDPNKCQQGD